MKVSIVVPTYQGGNLWIESARAIKEASKNISVVIIDSSSKDDTVEIAKKNGFFVKSIDSKNFNHGGTRNYSLKFIDDADFIVFLTQDAILSDTNAITILLKAFDDPKVVAAYGRQLPHLDASPLAVHARYFNYDKKSYISDISSVSYLGLKTVFISNSFSAYRTSTYKQIGGFPENTILCEDMFFAAKAVLKGYKIAYVSDAKVHHSHNYSAFEEFRRYFDIGVFHQCEPWIRQSFGGAGGEGKKFLLSEFKYLLKHAPLWIPVACMNNLFKIIGYKMGQKYNLLPICVVKKMSMHKKFWDGI
jgi:rhamnosyltransferase